MSASRTALAEELLAVWESAVDRAIGGHRQVSVLFSGGVDSSMVAVAARTRAEVELVTVGLRDSADLTAGREAAELLQLPWVGREVDRAEIFRAIDVEATVFAGISHTSRSVLAGLALALDATRGPLVLCGQGADELFLGYAHFAGLLPGEASARRADDLRRLVEADWPRSLALAERRARILRSPFLDPDLQAAVLRRDVELFQLGDRRKSVLRDVALLVGVPPALAVRPKRAFQYGSGIERALRTRHPAE